MSTAQNRGLGRILIADEDVSISSHLTDFLTRVGYEVDHAATVSKATARLEETDYAVLLLAENGWSHEGERLVERLIRSHVDLAVIVMAAYPAMDAVIAAMRQGACDYLVKPFDLEELKTAVARGCAHHGRLRLLRSVVVAEPESSVSWCGSRVDGSGDYKGELSALTKKGGIC